MVLAFGADEVDGAADGGGMDFAAEVVLGLFAEIAEDAGDEVFEGAAATEDFRAFEAFAGEEGFERLDEASARFGAEVPFDAFGAAPAFDGPGCAFLHLFEVEQGAVGFGDAGGGGEADDLHLGRGDGAGDGTVGSPEIDTDVKAGLVVRPGGVMRPGGVVRQGYQVSKRAG